MVAQHGAQHRRVLQARVDALARGRLHGVGRVPEEADPAGWVEARALHAEPVEGPALVEPRVRLVVEQVARGGARALLGVLAQLPDALLGRLAGGEEVPVHAGQDAEGDAPHAVWLLADVALVTQHVVHFRVHLRLPGPAPGGHETQLETPGLRHHGEPGHLLLARPPDGGTVAVGRDQTLDISDDNGCPLGRCESARPGTDVQRREPVPPKEGDVAAGLGGLQEELRHLVAHDAGAVRADLRHRAVVRHDVQLPDGEARRLGAADQFGVQLLQGGEAPGVQDDRKGAEDVLGPGTTLEHGDPGARLRGVPRCGEAGGPGTHDHEVKL
mmetsp:Transcript_113577/g.321622  ORF Transcript_113577/g.321622 Transcript_113577/m.321622 type:complete len:328 (-) Transcript_113577:118-1101(-)